MTRLNKYMVYNPKKDKPTKYFSNIEKAFEIANILRDKEHTDFLVLKVEGIAQYKPTPIEKIMNIMKDADWSQCNRCDGCGLPECRDISCATYKLNEIMKELNRMTNGNWRK